MNLDLDFANPLLFTPSRYAGIAVLRLPAMPAYEHLVTAVQTLVRGLARDSIVGKLWIIQPGRIRLYQEEAGELG